VSGDGLQTRPRALAKLTINYRMDEGLMKTGCEVVVSGGNAPQNLSAIGLTTDKVRFWPATVCPLMTQSEHWLALNSTILYTCWIYVVALKL